MSTISALTALAASAAAADDQTAVDDTSAAATKKIAFSELLDAILRVADAGDVLMLDATGEIVIIRQRGGTPGTDEVKVYYNTTYGGAGNVDFGPSVGRLLINGSECVRFNGSVLVASGRIDCGSMFSLPGGTSLTERTIGEVEVLDATTGRRDLAARTLIARQDGGVVGTDQVEMSHDGTNGTLEAKSGDLYIKAGSGGSTYLFGPLLAASGLWSFQYTGELTCRTLIVPSTAGSGAPNAITSGQTRAAFTNEGTTAENYNTLPTAAAGLDFEFVCQDSDGIRVTANTGDTIRDVGTVSASAGYIRSSTIGSVIRLKAINATEWFVVYKQGTWTIDS